MSGIFDTDVESAWCPGCGNVAILDAVKKALERTGKAKHEIVLVSGIGQAAKLPHHVDVNVFNGLHGRALPAALAIRMANPSLTVVVTSGDGDIYGEGGNHLVHNIRRNPDIAVFVHDNQVYGLTKGQPSPPATPGGQGRCSAPESSRAPSRRSPRRSRWDAGSSRGGWPPTSSSPRT